MSAVGWTTAYITEGRDAHGRWIKGYGELKSTVEGMVKSGDIDAATGKTVLAAMVRHTSMGRGHTGLPTDHAAALEYLAKTLRHDSVTLRQGSHPNIPESKRLSRAARAVETAHAKHVGIERKNMKGTDANLLTPEATPLDTGKPANVLNLNPKLKAKAAEAPKVVHKASEPKVVLPAPKVSDAQAVRDKLLTKVTSIDGMEKVTPEERQQIETILRDRGVPSKQVLYRGSSRATTPKVGEIVDIPWASASERDDHAAAYAENQTGGNHAIIYRLPPGVTSMDVSQYAEMPESEHLIGGNFRVVSIGEAFPGEKNSPTLVRLEISGNAWKPSAAPSKFDSRVITNPEANGGIKDAATALESVLKIDKKSKITELPGSDTATARSHASGDIGIHQDSKRVTVQSAVIHEYAHLLDRSVLGSENDWFTQQDGESGKLYRLMMDTPTVQGIKNDQVQILKGDPQGRAGLLQGRELFARAFEQYIAQKSGDPALIKRLDGIRNDPYLSFQHWPDSEFAPISAELDQIFAKHGMREAPAPEAHKPEPKHELPAATGTDEAHTRFQAEHKALVAQINAMDGLDAGQKKSIINSLSRHEQLGRGVPSTDPAINLEYIARTIRHDSRSYQQQTPPDTSEAKRLSRAGRQVEIAHSLITGKPRTSLSGLDASVLTPHATPLDGPDGKPHIKPTTPTVKTKAPVVKVVPDEPSKAPKVAKSAAAVGPKVRFRVNSPKVTQKIQSVKISIANIQVGDVINMGQARIQVGTKQKKSKYSLYSQTVADYKRVKLERRVESVTPSEDGKSMVMQLSAPLDPLFAKAVEDGNTPQVKNTDSTGWHYSSYSSVTMEPGPMTTAKNTVVTVKRLVSVSKASGSKVKLDEHPDVTAYHDALSEALKNGDDLTPFDPAHRPLPAGHQVGHAQKILYDMAVGARSGSVGSQNVVTHAEYMARLSAIKPGEDRRSRIVRYLTDNNVKLPHEDAVNTPGGLADVAIRSPDFISSIPLQADHLAVVERIARESDSAPGSELAKIRARINSETPYEIGRVGSYSNFSGATNISLPASATDEQIARMHLAVKNASSMEATAFVRKFTGATPDAPMSSIPPGTKPTIADYAASFTPDQVAQALANSSIDTYKMKASLAASKSFDKAIPLIIAEMRKQEGTSDRTYEIPTWDGTPLEAQTWDSIQAQIDAQSTPQAMTPVSGRQVLKEIRKMTDDKASVDALAKAFDSAGGGTDGKRAVMNGISNLLADGKISPGQAEGWKKMVNDVPLSSGSAKNVNFKTVIIKALDSLDTATGSHPGTGAPETTTDRLARHESIANALVQRIKTDENNNVAPAVDYLTNVNTQHDGINSLTGLKRGLLASSIKDAANASRSSTMASRDYTPSFYAAGIVDDGILYHRDTPLAVERSEMRLALTPIMQQIRTFDSPELIAARVNELADLKSSGKAREMLAGSSGTVFSEVEKKQLVDALAEVEDRKSISHVTTSSVSRAGNAAMRKIMESIGSAETENGMAAQGRGTWTELKAGTMLLHVDGGEAPPHDVQMAASKTLTLMPQWQNHQDYSNDVAGKLRSQYENATTLDERLAAIDGYDAAVKAFPTDSSQSGWVSEAQLKKLREWSRNARQAAQAAKVMRIPTKDNPIRSIEYVPWQQPAGPTVIARSGRGRLTLTGFTPAEAAAKLREMGVIGNLEPHIPADAIFGSGRRSGAVSPMLSEYIRGEATPPTTANLLTHGITSRGDTFGEFERIARSGGLMSLAERTKRGIRTSTTSQVGDIASGVDHVTFTSLGAGGGVGSGAGVRIVLRPETLLRRDAVLAPTDFGGGKDRFSLYKNYRDKLDAQAGLEVGKTDLWSALSPAARQIHLDNLNSSPGSSEYNLAGLVGIEDMLFISAKDPAVAEQIKALLADLKSQGVISRVPEVVPYDQFKDAAKGELKPPIPTLKVGDPIFYKNGTTASSPAYKSTVTEVHTGANGAIAYTTASNDIVKHSQLIHPNN